MNNEFFARGSYAFDSINTFGHSLLTHLPAILGALVVLVVGVILAGLLRRGSERLFKGAGVDTWPAKLMSKAQVAAITPELQPSRIISQFLYWVLIVIVLVVVSDILGWRVVSMKISDLLGYLPRLVSAVIIFVIGYYIAGFVRRLLRTGFTSMDMLGGHAFASAAFYLIMVFVTVSALDQAGVDTTLVSANITLIIGSLLLAFAVAFAIASRLILQNMLTFLYVQRQFKVGQQVTVGDVSGNVVQFDHMRMVVRSGDQDHVIPTRLLNEVQVRVKVDAA